MGIAEASSVKPNEAAAAIQLMRCGTTLASPTFALPQVAKAHWPLSSPHSDPSAALEHPRANCPS